MATNLYGMVSEANKNSKAVRIGYTVKSYDSVLKELQKAFGVGGGRPQGQYTNGDVNSGSNVYGNAPQPIFANRQLQGTLTKIGQHITDDGFVVDAAADYTKFRQQQVMLGSFMSFVMDIDDEDGKGKVTHFVPYESPRQRLNNGESCQGKNTYPAVNPQQGYKDYCTSLAKGVGNENKSIQIGVAVDLTSGTGTVDSFFKRCYPDIYKDGCGGKLAAKGALAVEIAFVEESKSKASTVVAQVIADSGESEIGKIHTIYLPVPLMLTDDYTSLVEVEVKDKKGNVTTVGSGTCTYPLSKSRFDYRKASLDSFTPKYLKDIVSKDERIHSIGEPKVKFHSKIIDVDGTKHEVAYIRFFIKDGVDLKGIFSTDEIPEAYSKEIYRGLGEMKVIEEIVGYEINETNNEIGGIYNEIGGITDMGKYFTTIVPKFGGKLTADQIAKAEMQVSIFEAGGTWNCWNEQDGDQGASIGRHQMSAKSGKILDYLQRYQRLGGVVSDGFMAAAKKAANTKGGTWVPKSLLNPYRDEFNKQCETVIGKQAQMENFFEYTAPGVITWFNKLGCTTPLELSSIIGAINHWPGGSALAYSVFKDKILQYRDNPSKRAEMIEKCHMAANYAATVWGHNNKSTWTPETMRRVPFDSLTPSHPKLHQWRARHPKMIKWAQEGKLFNW